MQKITTFLLFFLVSITPLLATKTKAGNDVKVNETVESDLYAAGNKITINSLIEGDLVAAGSDIFVNDSIAEDAILAAGNIFIEGIIGDDARLAGGKIIIRENIVGDAIIGGGEVYISEQVNISGNLYIAGGKVIIDGTILGDLDVRSNEIEFNGNVNGNTKLKGRKLILNGTFNNKTQLIGHEIDLNSDVQFYQDVEYFTNKGEMNLGSYLKNAAKANYNEDLAQSLNDVDWQIAVGKGLVMFTVFRVLAGILLITLLIWLFPRFWQMVGINIFDSPTTAIGYGMLYLLIIPLIVIIAFLLVIGIPIGIFVITIYGFSVAAGHALAAVAVTYWLQKQRDQKWSKGNIILVAIGCFMLLKLVAWIPILGWLISLAAVALVFGAIFLSILQIRTTKEISMFN